MSYENVVNITEKEKNAVRKSYNRTDEKTNEDIQHIQDWLKKQPHLPQNEDETRLRMLLYYNKFSLEKTKNKLDLYYSLKHFVPEFFDDREPSNPQISKQLDYLILMPLPNLTDNLNRVTLLKFINEDPVNFNIMLSIKLFFGMMDVTLMHDIRIGEQVILDMDNLKLGHVLKITPVIIKNVVTIVQKSYSDKIKEIHFTNVPSYAQALVSFLTTILSDKIASRIHMHKNLESLNKFISSKILPKEYGGTAGPLHELHDNWKKYYKSQNDWLKEIGDKKSDESKRVGQPIDSDLFGTCGSFRKLDFD